MRVNRALGGNLARPACDGARAMQKQTQRFKSKVTCETHAKHNDLKAKSAKDEKDKYE